MLTEHYSAFKADVVRADDARTDYNMTLLARLLKADRVIVCGQALSHCVAFSTRDLRPLAQRPERHRAPHGLCVAGTGLRGLCQSVRAGNGGCGRDRNHQQSSRGPRQVAISALENEVKSHEPPPHHYQPESKTTKHQARARKDVIEDADEDV